MPFPNPPDSINANFVGMNAKELRLAQEEIWKWLSDAESAPIDQAPNYDLIEHAHEALNDIIGERRQLHSDEIVPRGV